MERIRINKKGKNPKNAKPFISKKTHSFIQFLSNVCGLLLVQHSSTPLRGHSLPLLPDDLCSNSSK